MEACADKTDWRHDEARAIRDAWRPAPIFRSGPIVHAPIVDDDDEATVAPSTDAPCFYDDITDAKADEIYAFALSRAAKLDYLYREGFVEDECQQFTDLIMARIASGSYRDEGKPFVHYLSSQWRWFRFTRWHEEYEPRDNVAQFDYLAPHQTGEVDEHGEPYSASRIEIETLERFNDQGKLIPEAGEVYDAFDTSELKKRLDASWDQFTDAEKDVYALTAKGRTQEQVADELGSTVRTVRRRFQSMQERLGTAEAAAC